MSKLKVLELFGGIGAPRKALERLGIEHEVVDYVEIDKYAVKSYNAIYNDDFQPQDITTWNKDIKVDLIFHGSPCQDFSLAGNQAGADMGSETRSSLMWETIRIVEKLQPKYVIWENVKNVISKKHRHNFDMYLEKLESLGYVNQYQVLNAKDYGIPQNRERVFVVSILGDGDFTFPPKQELGLKLKDVLEDEVDKKYYLSEKAIQGRLITNYQKYKLEENIINDKEVHPTILARFDGAPTLVVDNSTFIGRKYDEFIEKKGYIPEMFNPYNNTEIKNIAPTQTTQCGSTASSATILIKEKVANTNIRKLTPKECWRLMGFDDEDVDKASYVNSNTQLYKQAGNSIVVNVLEAIFRELLK